MASVAASEMIFFIVTLLVTASAVGVLAGQTVHIMDGMQSSGQQASNMMQENFAIVNNPSEIPYNNGYVFYIKNTGSIAFDFSNNTVTTLINGTLMTGTMITYVSPGNTGVLDVSQVGEIIIHENLAGYNTIEVSLYDGVEHEMTFEVH
ncbi:MAG: flagellar protein G [Thermoplasmata archaeon]